MKSAIAWSRAENGPAARPLRGALERLVAVGYGLAYDTVVRRFPPYQALLDEIAALVARSGGRAPAPAVKVLDISCGTGTVAARLAADGYSVVAMDAVERLVIVARRRHGSGDGNPTFHHLDIARDPVPGAGTFDVLVSMHTLHWHPDPYGVLEACRRALKRDGHGVFLTYGRPARLRRTFAEVRARQGLGAAVQALRWLLPTLVFETLRHYEPRYLSREEFARALAHAGFEVLECRETFLAGLSLLAWARAHGPVISGETRR